MCTTSFFHRTHQTLSPCTSKSPSDISPYSFTMLPKFMSPFKMEGGNKRRKHVFSIESTTMDVGLRLLPQITSSKNKSNSNVLVKSAVRLKANQTTSLEFFCFLKTCNLCSKQLSPDKDIYMYRGDQGFCSVECRNRQIVLDEVRELESSTKQMVTSYNRQCCNDARKETRLILEDLRMQRLKSKPIPCNQNFWL